MTQVNIHQAKTQLSKLIEQAEKGEEVIIARAGTPVVQLSVIKPKICGRQFGAYRGKAVVDSAFFDPLPESELSAWE